MKAPLKLVHYCSSSRELGNIRNTPQFEPGSSKSVPGKPNGLWVSVTGERDWLRWCRAEDFHVSEPWRQYEIVLVEKPDLLVLSSAADLDQFTDTWLDTKSKLARLIPASKWSIDWEAVACEYKGIVIAPYVWERRLELSWYSGWDCASGCIWDASAIDKVADLGLIEHPISVQE